MHFLTQPQEVFMLDLPPEQFQAPQTEMERVVAEVTSGIDRLEIQTSEDDTLAFAKAMLETLEDGFQWSDIAQMIRLSYNFVQKSQGLTPKEQRDKIVAILQHVVHLTDTPYLPDNYTDPLFSSMIPPLVDIVTKAHDGKFHLIPAISGAKPSPQTFQEYIKKTQDEFKDGFQWSDLASCMRHTIEFVFAFPTLSVDEKKSTVDDILHHIIDATDTPYLPDNFVDPIFKSITRPTIDLIFENLGY